MRPFLKSILVVAFLSLSSLTAKAQVQKAVIKTAIVCDHCKQCETCGGLLEKKLIRHKGIQMITLDETKMTITVIYNSKKTDLNSIKTAISLLGYDADDIKADPKGYENLDGCCKA
ncbi:heavy-metal-associated domain-containing protein [Flavobacterium inviolabile]|uniref:heavy-metal-associated domain-containing protein n=1 Tax=Flavobacterium inviolabile TaxID=2748320 RepID=UPI0015AFF1FE|nr:cation transporter [Flavobacterium inviolabile]